MPWEQQESESPEAYHAFSLYRDLGPMNASLSAVRDLIHTERIEDAKRIGPGRKRGTARERKGGRQLRVVRPGERAKPPRPPSISQLEGWSSRHRWLDRAGAWWAELDRQKREEQKTELLQMAKRHASVLGAHTATLSRPAEMFLRRLQKLEKQARGRGEDADPFADMGDAEVFRLAIQAAKVLPQVIQAERLARGLSTEHVEVSNAPASGKPGSLLEDAAKAAEAWRALEESGALAQGGDT
jgi:hypothetical protein